MKIAGFSVLAAATLVLTGVAGAAPVSFGFGGHIAAGSVDNTNLFGGGDLGGNAFTMSITYDPGALTSALTTSGCNVSGSPQCVYTDQASGGGAMNGWLYITPITDGSFTYSLTINGHTSTTSNTIPNGPGLTAYTNLYLSYNGAAPPAPNGAYMSGQVYQQGPNAGVNTSFLIYSNTVAYQDQISSQGYINQFATDLCVGVSGNCRFFANNDTITLIGESTPAGAPEPATWFSLATGLATVGFMKFRSRKSQL